MAAKHRIHRNCEDCLAALRDGLQQADPCQDVDGDLSWNDLEALRAFLPEIIHTHTYSHI